jgi:non-specific serine/threonine protein kinase/serine/threonine-protein kinase
LGSIGNYRLVQKIGEGGMGEVYEAEQERPVRRKIALKIIKIGMDTKQVIARFEAERQALAMMDHANIARVYDAGATEQGRPYFVMEYVDGVPITEHCDRHRLTTRERLDLFIQVCEGVQHAHQKAIIHRDIKPTNILVTYKDGNAVPKIIDFGVAKAVEHRLTEKTAYTELGQLIGTPEYMSPEQAEMTGQNVDTRTDVYSLGVLLYELLVGALPFDPRELPHTSLDEIRRQIREVEPPKPSMKISSLDETSSESATNRRTNPDILGSLLRGDLDWITMKALEKDRARRYGTPMELAADIIRHIKNEPVQASPPSTAYRISKYVKRHTVGVVFAASALLLLLAFAVTMAVQTRRIAAERDRASREQETANRVSEFLADMIGSMDPQRLGLTLMGELREQVRENQRGRGRSEAEIEAAVESLAGVSGTDVALGLLDEEILSRAGLLISKELAEEPRISGKLEHTIGTTYEKLGLSEQAELHATRAAEIHQAELGAEHPATLASRSLLGLVYFNQGLYDEAEPLVRETLETQRRVLGVDHSDVFYSMSILANVYYRQGRYDESETLHRETLEKRRRVLGEDDPDTLRSGNSLANICFSQGRLDEAESLHRETLEKRRRLLGREHPDTLGSMSNLAIAVLYQGRYAEAESLCRETLEIRRRVLGEDHPNTLRSINDLALAYYRQDRFAEAEVLHSETLEIRRRLLGEEHPDTLSSLNNIAILMNAQGRHAEAETLHHQALEIQRRVLGEGHPDTLVTVYNLGCCAALRGDRKTALNWLRFAVEHGWSRAELMAKDSELDSLRGDPEFDALVEHARRNAAALQAGVH